MPHEKLELLITTALQSIAGELYRPYTPKNNRGTPCSVSGCPNVAYAKGFCNAHYIRNRDGRPMDRPLQHRGRLLTCLECDKPVDSKGGWGLCKSHYRQKRRQVIRRVCVEFLGGKCRDCSGEYPDYVYDLHHRSPHDKNFHTSNALDAVSVETIAKEVVKCDLLCANCHRIEHHGKVERLQGPRKAA